MNSDQIKRRIQKYERSRAKLLKKEIDLIRARDANQALYDACPSSYIALSVQRLTMRAQFIGAVIAAMDNFLFRERERYHAVKGIEGRAKANEWATFN